jgi:hypothetical protein
MESSLVLLVVYSENSEFCIVSRRDTLGAYAVHGAGALAIGP